MIYVQDVHSVCILLYIMYVYNYTIYSVYMQHLQVYLYTVCIYIYMNICMYVCMYALSLEVQLSLLALCTTHMHIQHTHMPWLQWVPGRKGPTKYHLIIVDLIT